MDENQIELLKQLEKRRQNGERLTFDDIPEELQQSFEVFNKYSPEYFVIYKLMEHALNE